MKNTQIYPVIKIGDDYFSTNNTTFEGNYCKPILLNIPSIKQSVDIEGRKFKISNVSLDLSNFPVSGERFSDRLSASSLINTEVIIYFVHHDTSQEVYRGQIRRISHDDEKVKINLEDLTEQKAHKDLPLSLYPDGTQGYLGSDASIPDKYKNKPIPMVYGKVERSPLVITSNFRSLIIDSKEIDGTNNESSEFEDTLGNSIKYGALYINDDNQYVNVIEDGQYISDGSIIEFDVTNQILFPDITVESDEKFFECLDGNNSFNFTVKNSIYGNDLQGEDYFTLGSLDKITDGKNQSNLCVINTDAISTELQELRTSSFYDLEKLFIDFAINYAPNYDFKESLIAGFKINGINLPKVIATLHGDNANAYVVIAKSPKPDGTLGDSISGTSEDYFSFPHMDEELAHDELRNLFGFFVGGVNVNPNAAITLNYTNSTIGATHSYENGIIVFYTDSTNNTLNIQFRGVYSLAQTEGVDELTFAPEFEMYGDINEISLLRKNKVLKPFSYDFYADVNGRINTFDDHPCVLSSIAFDPTFSLPIQQLGLPTNWFDPTSFNIFAGLVNLLVNPIDIIYDILRSELGLSAEQIDLNDFAEARKEHEDWEFGFTINKKINSKKLIEEIAKSTKCLPHFKNDGTFAFNTIKDSYLIEDDYNPATEIYEQDVINYSFEKTKPEQIISEVGVRYKKDYAQDSYSRDIFSYYEEQGWYTKYGTFNEYPHNWEYYGIYDPEDNYLEIESDYIRSDDTAHKLRSFLFKQHANAHLIFNLKLPLSYSQLDIGDLVKFRSLLNGVKPYGIDYRAVDILNGQYYYPLFMITSIKKNLDSIEIECMQLHSLTTGVEGSISQNTGYFNDNNEGNLFYFPDHTPATATPQDAQIIEEEGELELSEEQVLIPSSYYNINELNYYQSSIEFESNNVGELLFDYTEFPDIFFNGGYIRLESGELSTNCKITGIGSDSIQINIIGGDRDVIEYNQDITVTKLLLEEAILKGDVNFDGSLDILDIVTMVNYILGRQTPTVDQIYISDYNEDGGLNILDVVAFTNIVMGDIPYDNI